VADIWRIKLIICDINYLWYILFCFMFGMYLVQIMAAVGYHEYFCSSPKCCFKIHCNGFLTKYFHLTY
jgi:hypothetical protein